MKSLHDFKPFFIGLLKPFATILKKHEVTPIQLMIISFSITLISGLLMAAMAPSGFIFLILPLVLIIRLSLNAIDEILIKEHGMSSKVAFYLGELGDVASDIVLYLPFLFIPGISQVLVIFNVLGAVFTEFTGVLGLEVSKTRRYEGPMGKTDRALAFSIVAILYGTNLLGVGWVNFFLTIIFLAQALTIYNRVLRAVVR